MLEAPKNLNPLIDCDILAYRCGFSCKDDEPVENALHSAKLQLVNIFDAFPDRSTYTCFLTGKGNYREQIAKSKEYKGNRDRSKRPKYYDDIRRYYIEVHGATVVEGREADDAIGCAQWAAKDRSTVICSIDKDLKMIPGWHFNFVKNVVSYVTLKEANQNFLTQLVVGDTTDNIPGLKGKGKAFAKKLFEDEPDIKEGLARVRELYNDDEVFKEQVHLLWIQREEGVMCPYV